MKGIHSYVIRNVIGKFAAKVEVLKRNRRNSLRRQIRLQENSAEYTKPFVKKFRENRSIY